MVLVSKFNQLERTMDNPGPMRVEKTGEHGDPNDCLAVPVQPACLRYKSNYKVPQH